MFKLNFNFYPAVKSTNTDAGTNKLNLLGWTKDQSFPLWKIS